MTPFTPKYLTDVDLGNGASLVQRQSIAHIIADWLLELPT